MRPLVFPAHCHGVLTGRVIREPLGKKPTPQTRPGQLNPSSGNKTGELRVTRHLRETNNMKGPGGTEWIPE